MSSLHAILIAELDLEKARVTLDYLEGLAHRARELGGLCAASAADVEACQYAVRLQEVEVRRCVALLAKAREEQP